MRGSQSVLELQQAGEGGVLPLSSMLWSPQKSPVKTVTWCQEESVEFIGALEARETFLLDTVLFREEKSPLPSDRGPSANCLSPGMLFYCYKRQNN